METLAYISLENAAYVFKMFVDLWEFENYILFFHQEKPIVNAFSLNSLLIFESFAIWFQLHPLYSKEER